jgi:hypothetical protein
LSLLKIASLHQKHPLASVAISVLSWNGLSL